MDKQATPRNRNSFWEATVKMVKVRPRAATMVAEQYSSGGRRRRSLGSSRLAQSSSNSLGWSGKPENSRMTNAFLSVLISFDVTTHNDDGHNPQKHLCPSATIIGKNSASSSPARPSQTAKTGPCCMLPCCHAGPDFDVFMPSHK